MWKLTGQMMMSPDVHTFFAVMHLPLVSIGKAYLHIAFTETLILSFICIFVKLSLTRDLASASANK